VRPLPSLPQLLLAGAVAFCGCARNLTPSVPPLSDRDAVVAAAIRCAAAQPRPRCGQGPPLQSRTRVVIDTGGEHVSAQALPESDSVQYVLLSRKEIWALADANGDFVFIGVGRPRVVGDSAEIGVQTEWARHDTGWRFCDSVFIRHNGEWIFAHPGHCIAI